MAEPDVLETIATEVKACVKCALCQTRTRAVPGDGSAQAELLFIGEAPGLNEDRSGHPFVGPAGQFLDELLASVNLRRADCFITNVVKCRPPSNRDPESGEIAACADYLDRQIAAINPKLIVTLGRFSMAKFFPGESITRIHGRLRLVRGRHVLPLYHPAAALHKPELRAISLLDFKQVPVALELARQGVALETSPSDEPPKPEQMLLFDF